MPSIVMVSGLRREFNVSLDWYLLGEGSMWAGQASGAPVAEPAVKPSALTRLFADVVALGDERTLGRLEGHLEGIKMTLQAHEGGQSPPQVQAVRRRR